MFSVVECFIAHEIPKPIVDNTRMKILILKKMLLNFCKNIELATTRSKISENIKKHEMSYVYLPFSFLYHRGIYEYSTLKV